MKNGIKEEWGRLLKNLESRRRSKRGYIKVKRGETKETKWFVKKQA
jgi:hypothetical protein